MSPTLTTLPRRACRRTVELIEFVAMDEPVTETDRAPYTVTGPTTTEEFSVRPTFDMVTSSRRIVPAGVPVGARPATVAVPRAPMSAMASHSRMPNAANASGCKRTTPRRRSAAEVLSRTVRASSGEVTSREYVVD